MSRISTPKPFMLQMGSITTVLETPLGRNDYCEATLFDPRDESLYCAGITYGDVAAQNGDASGLFGDAFIVKFNRKRKIEWAFQLNQTGTQSLNDLEFDHEGYITAGGNFGNSPLLFRFSRDGKLINHINYAGPLAPCDHLEVWQGRYFCMNEYPSSSTLKIFELRLDGTSNVINSLSVTNTYAFDFKMDTQGNFYHVGSTEDSLEFAYSPPDDGYVRKVNQDGTQTLIKQISFGASIVGEAFAFTKSGNIVFAGRSGKDMFINLYQETPGNLIQIWNRPIPQQTLLEKIPYDVIEAKNGDIYVGGSTQADLFESNADGGFDAFIMRLDGATGVIKSGRQFGTISIGDGDNLSDQNCLSLVEDNLGNIICGGNTSGSTAEPRGGTGSDRDIMIWRVGPNLEF